MKSWSISMMIDLNISNMIESHHSTMPFAYQRL